MELIRAGGLPSRRKLTAAIRENGEGERHLGDLYVVRFAPGGDTYRVDVAAGPGLRSAVPIDVVAGSCRFRNGYPGPLIEAHAFSYMPPPGELLESAVAERNEVVQARAVRVGAAGFAPATFRPPAGGRFV